MATKPLIVGIGGTTRVGSTSERALRFCLTAAGSLGADTVLLGGVDLPQDPYEPGRPERSAAAVALVDAMRRANGIILSTPSYHGGISGLVKNAIDYAEDLREDAQPYFDGRAVGCIVCADGPQGLGATLTALRAVIHSLRGWPTPYAATINVRENRVGDNGDFADPVIEEALKRVAGQVVDFARMRLKAD